MTDTSAAAATGVDATSAAAAAAASSGAAAAVSAQNWYQGADPEIVGHIQNKGWHDKPADQVALEIVKAHREAEKHIGAPADQILKLPKDPNDLEGMKAVWSRLGVPAEAKGYEFGDLKFSDGTAVEQKFTDWLRTTLHTHNVPKSAAPQIASEFVKFLDQADQAESAEATAAMAQEVDKLKANWGANMEANKFVARQGAKALGLTEDVVDALEKTVGYSATMEALRRVGTLAGEDKFIRNDGGVNNGIMTAEQATARRTELMADEAWVKRYLAGGAAEIREMTSLNTILSA